MSATVADVSESIHNRGVYFDSVRFPDSVLRDFTNDAQTLIATIGKTKQAETTIVCGAGYSYPLPGDYFLHWAAILNADPAKEYDASNPPHYLDYIPPEKYGHVAFIGSDRPASFTVWGDSLLLNIPSYSENDTVSFKYLAEPTALTTDSSTIDLPDAFIPLLKDAVQFMCVDRITYPGRADAERVLQLTGFLNQAILGRPADAP
jgi:hypothetical protein